MRGDRWCGRSAGRRLGKRDDENGRLRRQCPPRAWVELEKTRERVNTCFYPHRRGTLTTQLWFGVVRPSTRLMHRAHSGRKICHPSRKKSAAASDPQRELIYPQPKIVLRGGFRRQFQCLAGDKCGYSLRLTVLILQCFFRHPLIAPPIPARKTDDFPLCSPISCIIESHGWFGC